ncbi:hypothetical protein LG198_05415 [Methylobacillus arboreus]|uniref:hypothetical protein n=1 Tax=Methylobacillus arboreus TaxID=755170 RepID=UPI001E44B930|nr:hypothetical protein [Methylobacillus arboreus]MCB5190161.1 hypothetical protein [Methylobacillus arboreus]
MLRKILLGYVLSLLLLFSQQSLTAHEISHLNDQPSHTQDQSPHTNLCEQCLNFGSLGSFIPASQHALPTVTSHGSLVLFTTTQHNTRFLAAYTSRGPPPVLI